MSTILGGDDIKFFNLSPNIWIPWFYNLDFVDKNFENIELKAVAQDGLYFCELNNTANKRDRDAVRIEEGEKPNHVKGQRTFCNYIT